VTVRPPRIAALPAFTRASELDADDNRKTLDQWTAAMSARLNGEVARWVVGSGGHTFAESDTMMVPVTYRKFRKWTARSLMEIAAQKTGRANFERNSVDEWRFEGNLASVRQMVDADFALVSMFQDGRSTGGRVAYHIFMGPLASAVRNQRHEIFWRQVGAACLVDLNDGRMVWCNAKADAWGDLAVPATAESAVGQLLTNLYYPSIPPDPPRGPAPRK
jgi:hypothetical protein